MHFSEKVAVITGASSGIGAALAQEFARKGAKVALLARRIEKLDVVAKNIAAHGGAALTVECDVTSRASLDAAMQQTVEAFGRIDYVVANAGFGVSGAMWRLTTDDYRRQFETNVFGVIDTVYAALPELEKTRGGVGLVGSMMGHIGMPASAPYCASKFAVTGFAEGIYYDLLERGVAVTLISPGIVASEIRTVNNKGVYTGKADPAPKWLTMPAETAARKIVRGMYRRKPEVIITRHAKFGIFMKRHFPRTTRAIFRISTRGRMQRIEAAKRAKDTP